MRFYYILILLASSCVTQIKFSDLKERSFNGPVKCITAAYYGTSQNNGYRTIDTLNLISKTKYYVDKQGNFTKITKQFFNQRRKSNETTEFKFEDSKKKSFVKTDPTGIIERGFFDWISDYRYRLTVYSQDSTRIETTVQLNENYRDKSGRITKFVNDSLISAHTYENTLNTNGEIIKINYNFENVGIATTFYENKEYDEYKNITLKYLKDSISAEMSNAVIREYEYY